MPEFVKNRLWWYLLIHMKEIWKRVSGYKSYKVSNLGNVVSKKSGIWVQLKPSKLSNHQRYHTVMLTKDGRQYRVYVHRLVLKAFRKNAKNKPHSNHINGIRSDNRLVNLEWATNKENQQHALRIGLHVCGERHRNAQLTNKQVLKMKKFFSSADRNSWTFLGIAKKYKVSSITIEDIYHKRTWKHLEGDEFEQRKRDSISHK